MPAVVDRRVCKRLTRPRRVPRLRTGSGQPDSQTPCDVCLWFWDRHLEQCGVGVGDVGAGCPACVQYVDCSQFVRPEREVEDFELTTDEIARIDDLDTGVRGGPEPNFVTLDNFGMTIPEA